MSKLRWLGLGLGMAAFGLWAVAQSSMHADMQGSSRPDGYHVVQKVPLPNKGGWDYLGIDEPAQRLYVSAGSQEDVLNARTLRMVGAVTGLAGTHGVAISDQDGHGFTSNGGDDSFTEFDLKTLKTIKHIPVPIKGPDGIIYDPSTDRIFAFNHDSHAVAVDAKTGRVVGTILLPSKAAEYAAADGAGHVYDNLEDSSQEIEIDARTLKITHVWPLAPCQHPSGLAMDTQSRRLFIGCHNNMMAIMNADTGKIVATEPIGGGVDANRFDPGTQLAFSSNGGNGTITVVHEDSPNHFTLVGNIPTESGARTMEVDTQTHTLFTVTATRRHLTAQQMANLRKEAEAARGRGDRFNFFARMIVPNSFHLIVVKR